MGIMSEVKKTLKVKEDFRMAHLTWPEAKARLKKVDIALLPVGSIEQHGPHLPLDTDAFDAEKLVWDVAKACKDPKPFVLPLLPYGVSYHHDNFSGTISVSPSTLSTIVYEIGISLSKQGIKKFIIINGHGGNSPALHFAAQLINRDAHIFTCVDTGETSDVDVSAMIGTPNDVHGGEIETSTALYLRPELVDMKKAKKSVPKFSTNYLDFTSERKVGWYAYTEKFSQNGVMGDPTKATREKGKRIWEKSVEHLVNFIEDIKQLSLDEMYKQVN